MHKKLQCFLEQTPNLNYKLALFVALFGAGDLLSTILCLRVFPFVCVEGNTIPAFMISLIGIEYGLLSIYLLYMGMVSVLLNYKRISKELVSTVLILWCCLSCLMTVRNTSLFIIELLGLQ